MKRFILLTGLCTSLLFAQSASADGYWGVNGGIYQFKNSSTTSPINIGVVLGADVSEIGSNPLAIEGFLNTSIIKGKASGNNFSLQTSALYAAMRTGKDDYFKLKLGMHSTTTAVGSSNASESALSYGIGFGFSDYEVEFTVLKGKTNSNSDLNLITVSYLFP